MADETPESVPIGPFWLTTPGDRSWTRSIPWVMEIPLVALTVYAFVSGPFEVDHIVAVLGLLLTMFIIALPGLVQLSAANRAWTHRTATLWLEGIVVDMPGREPLSLPWDEIALAVTRSMSLSMQIPPWKHLVTDFFRFDGERIAELTVHHSGYRRIGHKADVNDDGPSLLAVLQRTPSARALDLASRTLVELVVEADGVVLDGLSPGTVDEIRAGRLWHARRAAQDDRREVDRVPDALVRIDCVLQRHALLTAREAYQERPFDPAVRYYLARAILSHIATVAHRDAAAAARRRRLRDEALSLLEGLRGDPRYGDEAARDLRAIEARTLARRREEESSDMQAPEAAEPEIPEGAETDGVPETDDVPEAGSSDPQPAGYRRIGIFDPPPPKEKPVRRWTLRKLPSRRR